MSRFFDHLSQTYVTDAFEYIGRRTALRMEREAKPEPRTGDDFSCAVGDAEHAAFKAWERRECPQGDADSVKEQWQKAQPDADGWIKHDGNRMPVAAVTRVLVRFPDGCESEEPDFAHTYLWDHYGDEGDITHYRVVR